MQSRFSFHKKFQSPEETTQFASELAPYLQSGDTILFEGPIGAGKSHFCRALIQARLAQQNLIEDVPSPTFTLVQTYDDQISEIWHTDLYRLNSLSEIDELGLWDAFETAICLVEWPDRLGDYRPPNALTISLEPLPNDAQRRAHFHGVSSRWLSILTKTGLKNET